MLLRPTRLPRRFSRRVSKGTAAFVQRRHQRRRQYAREKRARWLRKSQRIFLWSRDFIRQWLLLSIATILFLAFAVLLFSPLVRVREVRVKRTDPRLESDRIQKSLRPVFGRHLFFLSAHDVKVLVQDAFPDAAEVNVDKQYPSTLALTVRLRPLVARLVIAEEGAAAPPTSTGSGKAHDYLTDNGLYVSLPFEAASSTALPLLRVVDWAVRPVPSAPLLSEAFLQRLHDAEAALRGQFGLSVTGRTVYLRAREFHLQTPRYVLWFDLSSPLADQLKRYRIFLQSVAAGEAKQYVDLRLAGKVVFQ